MTARTYPIPADRLEWLALRQALQQQGHVSASSAGALCGVSDYDTVGDLAVRYLAPEVIAEDRQTDAQRRGHLLEPACARWLEEEMGVMIATPTVMYACDGWAMTPDGEFVGSDTDLPEFKTYKGYLDGELLPSWRCQAVAQCVARPSLQRVHFAVLDSSLRFQHVVVEPSQAERDDMIERAARFLAFIALGLVPEDAELSEQNVRALWPTPEPEATVAADAEVAELATEWAIARRARLDAEKAEQALKDRLADAMRDAALLTLDGEIVVTYRANGRGRTLAPAGSLK